MRKDSRLFKALRGMSAELVAVHMSLLDGRAALLGGFAVSPCKEGWVVHGMDAKAEQHTVLGDLSTCSCPDRRFRGRECKHLKALKRWLS